MGLSYGIMIIAVATIVALLVTAVLAFAIPRLKTRIIVLILGLVIGFMGLIGAVQYHEVCCISYNLAGDYLQNPEGVWWRYFTFIAIQIILFGKVVWLYRLNR